MVPTRAASPMRSSGVAVAASAIRGLLHHLCRRIAGATGLCRRITTQQCSLRLFANLKAFHCKPSEDAYWQHGRSTEHDFIYVTTQTLTKAQLDQLSLDVGSQRTLLVCCGAWKGKASNWDNLTLKKIPQAVLSKCEWGRDDYSLEVRELPDAPRVAPTQGDIFAGGVG